jgi:Mn-dependent DtxR family transcriptional regulator
MKIQEAAEMYLETILILSEKLDKVRSIDVANEMNYAKPTVSVMMKQFRNEDYINFADDGTITLTEKGRKIAERIYERHKVLTNILIALGVNPQVAQKDACKMEHDISDETFVCLRAQYNKNNSISE